MRSLLSSVAVGFSVLFLASGEPDVSSQDRLTKPFKGKRPHIFMVLWDDYGWASASWHRNYTIGGVTVQNTHEVKTPHMHQLVRQGIELDRAYVFHACSPTRSSLQSGRSTIHVNVMNLGMDNRNPDDPVSGFSGIPRNMTGMGSKMAAAGYRTAMFGKWDVGMATPAHSPDGRGYQSGLWYFWHDNDYWSSSYQKKCDKQVMTDLWLKPFGKLGAGALGYNSTCSGMQGAGGCPTACKPGPKGDHWYGGYEEALFEQQILSLIEEHDPTQPLFVYWAPHTAHAPLQVPDSVYDEFDFIGETDQTKHQRQRYAAMVKFTDEAVGNVTKALKAKDMWQDTLVVFLADNGGWVSKAGVAGGNNYPLKGGKYNNWEGGIRSNSFVSGGFVPRSRRGTRYEGLVGVEDWYGTFCSLAGVDPTDTRAADAGLPPVDSVDLSAVLLEDANAPRPRRVFPIGTGPRVSNLPSAPPCSSFTFPQPYDGESLQLPTKGNCSIVAGIIADDGDGKLWKLIMGDEKQYVGTGEFYPNSTTGDFDSQDDRYTRQCGGGCLYEIVSDPLEDRDLADAMPEKLEELRGLADGYVKTAFFPNRGSPDPKACAAAKSYGGFWGPWVDVPSLEGPPSRFVV